MSFSDQRAVCYLFDSVIAVLIANWVYKMSVMLKHQQFEDGESNKTELRVLKRQ